MLLFYISLYPQLIWKKLGQDAYCCLPIYLEDNSCIEQDQIFSLFQLFTNSLARSFRCYSTLFLRMVMWYLEKKISTVHGLIFPAQLCLYRKRKVKSAVLEFRCIYFKSSVQYNFWNLFPKKYVSDLYEVVGKLHLHTVSMLVYAQNKSKQASTHKK